MKIGMVEQAQVRDADDKIVVTGQCLRYEDNQGRGIVVPVPPEWPDGDITFDAMLLRILVEAMEGNN